MSRQLVRLGIVGLVLAVVFSTAVSAQVITDVVRANGQSGDRDPVGRFDGERAPLATEDGGLMDGNLVFSDRTYPWSMTPAEMVGSEYIRTYNTDKNGGTTDVTYTVTIAEEAWVWITVDDRIPAEWDNGGTITTQQEAADLVVAAFAEAGTFSDTGLDLFIHEGEDNDRQMSVYAAELPAGTYVFGSQDSGKNFYSIGAISLGVAEPVNPGDAGLVLFYDFEADANDMSGNGNDGALLGDAAVMDGVLVLDGDDDAVAIPRIGGEEAVYSQISYGMWVYSTTDLTGLQFAGGMNTSPWGAGAVHLKLSYGQINVGINGLDGGDLQGATVVDPNGWNHLALTVSDSEVAIYLNGVLEDSRALAAPLEDLVLGSATLGAWENGDVQREMAGYMDDVMVYDRALSAAEVQWLAGLRPIVADPGDEGLKVYYALENDANDLTGNGFDGVLMGDPTFVEGVAGMALECDGDDYVDTGYTEDLAVWTISCWTKSPMAPDPAGSPSGPLHREKNYQINWNHGQDSFRAAVGLATANGWFGANFGDLEADEWYNLVGSYDGEDLKAYKNGVLMAVNSDPSGPTNSESNSLKLGRHAAAEQYFTGTVDEAMVYDRVLSGGEILYLAGWGDVTAAGDVVQGVPNDGDWPGAETPDLAIDDNVSTKYLHFKGDFDPDAGPTGIQVTPAVGPTVVTGLTFTTANDVPGRDPIAFELSGSNDGIDGPYTVIASGLIADFGQEAEWERFTKNETPIGFYNTTAYTNYQVVFTAIRGPVGGSVNSMQIAEIELLGVVAE